MPAAAAGVVVVILGLLLLCATADCRLARAQGRWPQPAALEAALCVRCRQLFPGCSGGNQGGFEYVQSFLELLVAYDQRHQDAHYAAVSAGGDGDEAVFVAVTGDFFRGLGVGLARGTVLHQLNGTHAAQAADVADYSKLLVPEVCALRKLAAKMHGS